MGLFVGRGDVYGEGLVWLVRAKVVGRVKVQGGWCRIEGLGRAKVKGINVKQDHVIENCSFSTL